MYVVRMCCASGCSEGEVGGGRLVQTRKGQGVDTHWCGVKRSCSCQPLAALLT